MKFEISKEELLRKLNIASKFCLSKISSNSSLQGVLVKVSKDRLDLISTNLIDLYHSSITIKNTEENSFVIDVKKAIEFLNFLPSGVIEIEIEKSKLVFRKGKTEGTFNTMSAQDFPQIPVFEGLEYVLDKKIATSFLPLIIFSTAKDESRPVLTGVNWVVKNDQYYMVSTDGFRLSLFKSTKIEEFLGNISANVLNEVLSLLEGEDLNIKYSKEDKKIVFNLKEGEIYSQLIEGDFPPFEKVIPDGYKTRIILDREEFVRNIKLNSIFARDFSNIVIFDIRKDGLYIKPKTTEEGSMVTSQEVEFEGEEQKISFNFRFVMDFLNNIKTKKVIFEMNSKNAPGIFKLEKEENYIHIIMPVRTDE